MRHALLALWIAALAAGPQLSAQNGARVEGRIASTTGEPVRRALVRLQLVPPPGPRQQAATDVYTEMTDAAGRFVFQGLPPGSYLLTSQKTGFELGRYTAEGASPQLTLEDATVLRDIQVSMRPDAVIAGTVFDADGEPAFGVQVRIVRVAYQRGQPRLAMGASTRVDDRGEFRLTGVTAGRYFLLAEDSATRQVINSREHRGASAAEVNLSTYYPSELDVRRAALVEAAPGAEAGGIHIRMRRGRMYSISGRVEDPEGQPVAVALSIYPKSSGGLTSQAARSAGVRDGGEFEVGGLPPGDYVIQATPARVVRPARGGQAASAADPPKISGRLEVSVGGADIENLVLAMRPNLEIAGRVTLEDGEAGSLFAAAYPGAPRPAPRVTLNSNDGGLLAIGRTGGVVGEDGTFVIHNVAPLRQVVSLTPMPRGLYLKSIRFAGHELANAPLDLTLGAAGVLELVLASDGGEVAGVVRGSSGDPLPGAAVVLWPSQERQWDAGAGLLRLQSGAGGAFRFTGVPPGDYRLAAFEEIDAEFAQAYGFVSHFGEAAAEVHVGGGGRVTADPKLIGRPAVEAQMGRLP